MIDPQPYFVSRNDSIKHVIEVIDKGSAQVAIVVSGDHKLIGIVTDGDIRRAILKGISLDNKVERIMTQDPYFVDDGTSAGRIHNVMRQQIIQHVPVVNNSKIVTNLYVLEDLLQKPSFKNPIVLMAGGKGERLRPLTENCPKPMLEIRGKPMLEIILEKCQSAGFTNFYISVNYLKHQIIDYFQDGKKWDVNIKYLEENESLGTCGCLNLLPKDISDDIIVMNGDIITDLDLDRLMRFHAKKRSLVTVCSRSHRVNIPFAVLNSSQNKLLNFIEKPTYEYQINAGVYALRKKCIKEIPNNFFNMTDLIDKILKNNEEIGVFPVHENWNDIGNPTDFGKLNGSSFYG